MTKRYKVKADFTPEEWSRYLEKMRSYREKNKDKMVMQAKIRNSKPEVIERKKEYYKEYSSRQEVKDRLRDKRSSEEYKEHRKKRYEEAKSDASSWNKRIRSSINKRAGFTDDLIQALIAAQDNKCAVCGKSFNGENFVRDHCHDSKKPRGLLCHRCNILEGMITNTGFSPEEFGQKLGHYLKNPPSSKLIKE